MDSDRAVLASSLDDLSGVVGGGRAGVASTARGASTLGTPAVESATSAAASAFAGGPVGGDQVVGTGGGPPEGVLVA